MKKCAMPLSEPLVDHRPRSEMVLKRLTYSGDRGGIVTYSAVDQDKKENLRKNKNRGMQESGMEQTKKKEKKCNKDPVSSEKRKEERKRKRKKPRERKKRWKRKKSTKVGVHIHPPTALENKSKKIFD